MGAHSFDHHVTTSKSAVDTYRELVAEATFESGHDGYNGTISTTSGVRVVPGDALPLAEAYRVMDKRINNLRKWEDAEALAVFEAPAATQRKFTKKVKITTEQIAKHGSIRDALEAVARESVTLRAGETLLDVTLVQIKDGFYTRDSIEYRTKVTEVPTEGAKQTRYFIEQGQHGMSQHRWAEGHATLTEAKRALTAALREAKNLRAYESGASTYSIVAETRRENGQPLTTLRSEVVSATAEVEYAAAKLPSKAQRTGWLIYGLAAS